LQALSFCGFIVFAKACFYQRLDSGPFFVKLAQPFNESGLFRSFCVLYSYRRLSASVLYP
jgi:hypothetical protein